LWSLFVALLLLLPQAATAQEQAADHVVIVLDASGSMSSSFRGGDEKMEVAKDALLRVFQDMPPTTRVGVLVFEGRNTPSDGWLAPLGPPDAAALQTALEPIRPRGGTPLGRFMKRGADALLEARQAANNYGTYRLLIVTDGEADDQRMVDRYLPDVLSRGITVDVIGVAMDEDLKLAQNVNSYRRADDPEALARQLTDVFAEVGRGTADALTAEEAYELIAALPDAAAPKMLAALNNSGNDPIGTARRTAQVERNAPADNVLVDLEPEGSTSLGAILVGACGGFGFIVLLVLLIAALTFYRVIRQAR
jgi:hypothetical protein